MTTDEARFVLRLMLNVESGCAPCAADMMARFASQFPEHRYTAAGMYRERHEDSRLFADALNREDEQRQWQIAELAIKYMIEPPA